MGSNFSIVVGLGNPGENYRGTRHNIGFQVVDEWLKSADPAQRVVPVSQWKSKSSYFSAEVRFEGRLLRLVKPQRFMNLSGPVVREIMDFFKLPCVELIVVHDDIDLPLGNIRVKQAGGDGGHKGIRSIVSALGSPDFVRLRVGVGRPAHAGESSGMGAPESWEPNVSVTDWVLGHFSQEESVIVSSVLERACLCLEELCASGVAKAQCLFNASTE